MRFFLLLSILLPVLAQAHDYEYRAVITEVYDGDTVTVDIDLGFNTWRKGEKLRLARIDAPEVRGEYRQRGLDSKEWLKSRVLNQSVTIRTKKDGRGKYGRYIVEIIQDGENLNDVLVRGGMAVYREY